MESSSWPDPILKVSKQILVGIETPEEEEEEDVKLIVGGKVGIGTETPSEALDVIGNIAATGDISATNLNLNNSLTINQNLTINGNFQLGTLSINEFSSDGNLADNSNLAIPTEQAVKTYVDNQIKTRAALNGASDQDFTAQNLTVSGNVTGSLTVENDLTVGNAIATKEINATGKIQANRFEGDGSGLDGIVKKAGDTMTGALTVNGAIAASTLTVTTNAKIGGNLKVDGNLEVMGNVTASDVEHVSGNVSFGDADDDEVKITGVLRSGHSSGALRVDDALHATGSLTVNDNLSIGTSSIHNPQGWNRVLDILGSAHARLNVRSTGGVITSVFSHDNWGGPRGVIGTESNHPLTFATNYRHHMTIDTNGNVGIGTTSPTFRLDVRGNNGWIGSGDSSQSQGGWRLGRWPAYSPNTWVYLVRADSTKYQDLAVGALWAGGALRFGSADDLAEMTPVKAEDNLEPGDVVVIENPPDNRVLLAKSNKPNDSKVAGVISDPSTAGLIIGGSHPTDVNRDNLKPLALAGRILTKVTTENGSINAGDFLTTSHTPGCAMKANIPGYTLGKALQCFNGNENGETMGKIWVLVNLGWVGDVTKE